MKDLISERKLPDILENVTSKSDWEMRREEIKELLQREEYGFFPPKPDSVEFYEDKNSCLKNFAAGKAELRKYIVKTDVGGKRFSFPFYATIPCKGDNIPAFLHINFRDAVPDRYMPNEEIMDNGFAVFSFCYEDITSDNKDFSIGLAGVLLEGKERQGDTFGKITLWAWAAMRVMDCIEKIPRIDTSRVAVCGHSRLGKTALLCGAFDERFCAAFSNDSGCCGAAISRDKIGETVEKICDMFPYWFCKNFYKYKNAEHTMPFDQHFLSALIAPRRVYIASAKEDLWADPLSEQLTCFAASPVWELLGKPGFVAEDREAHDDEAFHDGFIGYHKRSGSHYFGREDWLYYFYFMKKHFF